MLSLECNTFDTCRLKYVTRTVFDHWYHNGRTMYIQSWTSNTFLCKKVGDSRDDWRRLLDIWFVHYNTSVFVNKGSCKKVSASFKNQFISFKRFKTVYVCKAQGTKSILWLEKYPYKVDTHVKLPYITSIYHYPLQRSKFGLIFFVSIFPFHVTKQAPTVQWSRTHIFLSSCVNDNHNISNCEGGRISSFYQLIDQATLFKLLRDSALMSRDRSTS